MTLYVGRVTWEEIIPSIFRCANKIGLEVFAVIELVSRVAEVEGVGLWEDGVGDAAEKLINFG